MFSSLGTSGNIPRLSARDVKHLALKPSPQDVLFLKILLNRLFFVTWIDQTKSSMSKKKSKGKNPKFASHLTHFAQFRLNLKEGFLYIEYGPALHWTELTLPGTQFDVEEDEVTFLPSISASFPSELFCHFNFWRLKRTTRAKRWLKLTMRLIW